MTGNTGGPRRLLRTQGTHQNSARPVRAHRPLFPGASWEAWPHPGASAPCFPPRCGPTLQGTDVQGPLCDAHFSRAWRWGCRQWSRPCRGPDHRTCGPGSTCWPGPSRCGQPAQGAVRMLVPRRHLDTLVKSTHSGTAQLLRLPRHSVMWHVLYPVPARAAEGTTEPTMQPPWPCASPLARSRTPGQPSSQRPLRGRVAVAASARGSVRCGPRRNLQQRL